MKNHLNTDQGFSGLLGDEWYSICKACHEEVKECCIDVELTLFPDEIKNFKEKDPTHLHEYEDQTFGYVKKGSCCFLTEDKRCQLQEEGITKPIDCLIYPLNYKNGNIFLDTSCWAKELLVENKAISTLYEKLNKYPHYKNVQYEESKSDVIIQPISLEFTTKK